MLNFYSKRAIYVQKTKVKKAFFEFAAWSHMSVHAYISKIFIPLYLVLN